MSKAVYLLQVEGERPVAFTTQRSVELFLDGYIKAAMNKDEQWDRGICMKTDEGGKGAAGGPFSLWGHLWDSYAKNGRLDAHFVEKTEHHGNRRCSPHGGMYSEMMWTRPGNSFSLTEINLLNRNDAQWFRDFGTTGDLI